MVKREGIEIQSKYTSKQSLYDEMKSLKKDSLFKQPFNNKMVGTFNEDHSFMLSSTERLVGMFVFKGELIKRGTHIVMVGDISVKSFIKAYIVAFIVFAFGFSGYLFSQFCDKESNIWLMITIGFLLAAAIILPVYLKLSNSLYKLIVKEMGNGGYDENRNESRE